VYCTVVVSGSDNVIKPMLLRGSARIHPLMGFLSIIGGVLAFGVFGFLIGPVVLSLVLSAIRIYRLDVLSVPTNRPLRRYSYDDRIYLTEKEKWKSVVEEIVRSHATGRPVLVGTTSIDANEITDKGYLNQRAVLARRAALVEKLYASDESIVTAD